MDKEIFNRESQQMVNELVAAIKLRGHSRAELLEMIDKAEADFIVSRVLKGTPIEDANELLGFTPAEILLLKDLRITTVEALYSRISADFGDNLAKYLGINILRWSDLVEKVEQLVYPLPETHEVGRGALIPEKK